MQSDYEINFRKAEFVKSGTRSEHYPEPIYPEVAVLGRSNVGKSSLLNSLLNRKALVRVSRTPGRTQLINFFVIDEKLFLVDLPGYGFAKVPKRIKKQWRPMIERYLEGRQNLVGCLFLLDVRRIPSDDDIQMWNWLRHYDEINAVPVLTKGDKLSAQKRRNQAMKIANVLDVPLEALIITSSKTHAGRDKLRATIEAFGLSAEFEEVEEVEDLATHEEAEASEIEGLSTDESES